MKLLSLDERRRVPVFLLLVALFSGLVDLLLLRIGQRRAGQGYYVLLLMWTPALAALATAKLCRLRVSDFGWAWGQTRYPLLAWALPLGYSLLAYLFIWISGWGHFYDPAFVDRIVRDFHWQSLPRGLSIMLYALFTGTLGVIRGGLAGALGEEIGWRGFLVPALSRRLGFVGVSLVSAVVWILFHGPVLVLGDYNNGTPWWFGLTCFSVLCVGASFLLAWLRLRSGSLWTGVIFHASHNSFVQAVFTPLTQSNEHTPYAIDEFGFALPVAVALVATIVVLASRPRS